MRIGFLMDPLERVRVEHDSTFALMLECQRRGLEIRELRQDWLYFAERQTRTHMRTVEVQRKPGAQPPSDLNALVAKAARDLADYQRLTAEGKLGEAGQKLEQLKRILEDLNAHQK